MNLQAKAGNMSGNGGMAAVPMFDLDYHGFTALHQLMRSKLDAISAHVSFINQLAYFFPEVAERIDEADFGVLHLEMGAMKQATRDAIERRDWHQVRAHFSFIDGLLAQADKELGDAVHVSYLGNLLYGETSLNYAKARSLLPKPLAVALERIETHYEQLVP